MQPKRWRLRHQVLEIGLRPLIMGVVNVTPDSFSDGGQFFDPAAAVAHGLRLVEEGADIIDVGGESTRPGAEPVPLEEELRRVLPVVTELAARTTVPISVDTMKAVVARECLRAGACIINDVTGLQDPEMVRVAARFRAGVVVLHMQGTPQTMQLQPHYQDVVAEVAAFFRERLAALAAAGLDPETVAVDPGIGFGKTLEHNLQLLARLEEIVPPDRPVVLGVSRKGFLGQVTGRSRQERVAGTLAVNVCVAAWGQAHVWRVHDVAPHRDAALLMEAISRYRP